jgi:hypothetical protein
MPGECARLRHPLSNHSPRTRRTPWRKARCAATRKRRSRSRTRTRTRVPPPPRRSPACTARPPQSRTARNSRRGAQQTPSPAGGGSTREARRGGVVRYRPDFRAARRRRECLDLRRAKPPSRCGSWPLCAASRSHGSAFRLTPRLRATARGNLFCGS